MIVQKRFCPRCERVTQDGHMWCSDRDCAADQGYPLFDYGDAVGDLKVLRLIVCWRSGALYEAQRAEKLVWLKVAHRDEALEKRLKIEAHFLRTIAPRRSGVSDSFFPQSRPKHLVWLPPYSGATAGDQAHGEITIAGRARIFAVFQAIKGSMLKDVLLESPNVWHKEAAWVTIALADALQFAAAKNLAHLCLTPDMVFVETDGERHMRPTLLDHGWLWAQNAQRSAATIAAVRRSCAPAYTAPEIMMPGSATKFGSTADTYSLGIILYEMLSGRSGFDTKVMPDDAARALIADRAAGLTLDRPELKDVGVVSVVQRAIALNQRYATPGELGRALAQIYSEPPKEKRRVPVRFYFALGLALLLLAGIFGFMIVVLLQAITSR